MVLSFVFFLLTIWAESFDYIPEENQQFRAVLELLTCPTTKGKSWYSSGVEWRRLLPSGSLTSRKALLQVPSLKQCCPQLTGCQHSQNYMQDLSQSRNICEGGRKMWQRCNPGKSQSSAHLFCLTLHWALKAAVCSVLTTESFHLSFGLLPDKMKETNYWQVLQYFLHSTTHLCHKSPRSSQLIWFSWCSD